MKTLNLIQKFMKVGKIISKIIFICCCIGAIACFVSIGLLAIISNLPIEIEGQTLVDYIMQTGEVNINELFPSMAALVFICAGEAVVAKFAEIYFNNELNEGNPFTFTGAKELLRLGVLKISVPLVAVMIAEITSSIIAAIIDCENNFSIESGENIIMGIMLIIISFIFKYGAEIMNKNEEEDKSKVEQ